MKFFNNGQKINKKDLQKFYQKMPTFLIKIISVFYLLLVPIVAIYASLVTSFTYIKAFKELGKEVLSVIFGDIDDN